MSLVICTMPGCQTSAGCICGQERWRFLPTTTRATVNAPWTPEQVKALDEYQRAGRFHPFTCPNRDKDHPHEPAYGDHGVLRPTVRGWICAYCDYTQGWAHGFMATGETR